MGTYTLTEILDATSGRLIFRGTELFTGISIDSRTIKDGELFIALKGARFDGHDFINDALMQGGGALVSSPPLIPVNGRSVIHVNNTLKALHQIAQCRRLSRNVAVIAVTGTNGKTTTKEMIASILTGRYSVLTSKGNLNNQIGLPISLSGLDEQEFAVLEMGASRPGDIRELCEIARPDVGVLTNISQAHLAGFHSVEAVRDTKLELAEFINTLVLNMDDPHLGPFLSTRSAIGDKRLVLFGLTCEADFFAEDIRHEERGISFTLHIRGGDFRRVRLRIFGVFNVLNALAATAACHQYGMPLELISNCLEAFGGVPMRLEIKELQGALVISDLYNANPASMEEAVKELIRLRKSRGIAVLGDMLELGAYGEEAHRKLGRWLAHMPVDILITVGDLMRYTAEEFSSTNETKPSFQAKDPSDARTILLDIVKSSDTVLIKGSRGMRLERVLEG